MNFAVQKKICRYTQLPDSPAEVENHILICGTCKEQIEDPEKTDPNHWRCLNDSMWSTVPAVQVMAWRMLNRLKGEGWPQDLLDMMYMEEDQLAWAKAGQAYRRNFRRCGTQRQQWSYYRSQGTLWF